MDKRVVEFIIVKQSESKYEVLVDGIKVMSFMKYENALQYEKDLQELNPYKIIKNKFAID